MFYIFQLNDKWGLHQNSRFDTAPYQLGNIKSLVLFLVFVLEAFDRVLFRCLLALQKDSEERDNQAEQSSSQEYQRVQANPIRIAGQPISHDVPRNRSGEQEGNDDIHQECFHQLHPHLFAIRTEHFAYRYFQRALLDEIGRHR